MKRLTMCLLATLFAGAIPAMAQQAQEPLRRALELERRGDQPAAAVAYREALERRPTDVGALLGLDRMLESLGRGAEMVPFARAALDGSSDSAVVHSILVRGWVAAGESDSARAAAEAWAAHQPGDEGPYRELGLALMVHRDRDAARGAFLLGRERTGRPAALAPELAQLAVSEGDYAGSVREWLLALEETPGYRLSAVSALSAAPPESRSAILDAVERSDLTVARQLEAGLRARWGDPVRGFEVLSATLGDDRVRSSEALRDYLEQVRADRTPAGRRAAGMTLEALAELVPASQAQRLRADAAQAYAEGGEREAARRVLGRLATDSATSDAVSAGATSTLIEVLVEEGKVAEAEARLGELEGQLPSEDQLALRRRVAEGYVRLGRLDHADSLVQADRSIEGMALAGRIALYRGDLAGAVEDLRAAGPFAGTRDAATARAALLALLQPIERDSLPALGAAFLRLEQGDTAAAVKEFESVAADLPAAAGGAELQLLAGRLAAAQGHHADAERLLRMAAGVRSASTAPAAGLELGRLLLSLGRHGDAVATLEELILTWPRSALVPQARRLLDEARGAIPRT